MTCVWLLPLATVDRAVLGEDSFERPHVLLIVSDDQRPDTIGALGNPHIQTPNLDALVRRGTAVTRAICANPICTPSRAELMTGRTGFRTGVRDFGGRVDTELPKFAGTLQQSGYTTAYVGKWHNNGQPRDWGYQQTPGWFGSGGGRWSVPTTDWHGRTVTGYRGWAFKRPDGTIDRNRPVGLTPDISARFADAAIEFIDGPHERPFFLHVNFTAPHDPLLMPFGYEDRYQPDKIPLPLNFRPGHEIDHGNLNGRDEVLLPFPRTPQDVRQDLAVYYAVITHLDAQIGRILQALDKRQLTQQTLVVFTSDHGLAMGSHGLRGKQNMYEHTIGVPLILAGPAVPAGQIRSFQCALRDLYPTVCDLCGVAVPDGLDGVSLRKPLSDPQLAGREYVFGYFRDFQRMVRDREWKLIHYPQQQQWQLFHLADDPAELQNLAEDPAHRRVRARLEQRLRQWQQEVGDPVRSR